MLRVVTVQSWGTLGLSKGLASNMTSKSRTRIRPDSNCGPGLRTGLRPLSEHNGCAEVGAEPLDVGEDCATVLGHSIGPLDAAKTGSEFERCCR